MLHRCLDLGSSFQTNTGVNISNHFKDVYCLIMRVMECPSISTYPPSECYKVMEDL